MCAYYSQPNTAAPMNYAPPAPGYPAPATYAAPQFQAPPNPQPPVNAPKDNGKAEQEFISTKIWKINGKDKVVDFQSRLIKAYDQDFANIHGIGGSNHAPNSTISVNLCDFTKGKGQNSVTVKYGIDVEDMSLLYHAAMAARLGQLGAGTVTNSDALVQACQESLNRLRGWLSLPPLQDNSRVISYDEITAVGKSLSDSLNAMQQAAQNTAPFTYVRQKNNPYSTKTVNGVSYAPVSQINLTFDPSRRYPWTIHISNYDAPIKQQKNGATTHNAKQAINMQEAFINISMDDFCAAMVAVNRFVHLWEQRMFRTLDTGCTQYERSMENLRKKGH
jgi:hypothetical protein